MLGLVKKIQRFLMCAGPSILVQRVRAGKPEDQN